MTRPPSLPPPSLLARRRLLAAPLALPALLRPGAARAAQAGGPWPDRAVRIVVTFPAGSITDALMRVVAEGMSHEIGQPVIIDNRPGGSGVVGTQAAIGAPADGHVLLAISVTTASINPHVLRNLPYDPVRDLVPVGFVCESPYMLVASPALPARTVPEFLDLARARPGELTYSHGNQSALIFSAMMAKMAGVRMLGVPYRGGAEALTDVVAGRISSTFTDFVNGPSQAREGRVRALGVSTRERFRLAPELPPIADTLPGYDLSVWFGLAAPPRTPAAVTERANAALNRALNRPDTQSRLAQQGLATREMTPAAFGEHVRTEVGRWGELVREVGIEPA